MTTRRAVPVCLLLFAAHLGSAAPLHRYWPRLPRPKTVLIVPFVGDHEEGMTLETAAGLAADAVNRGRGDTMVLEDHPGSDYRRWAAAMLATVKPQVIRCQDTWAVVAELQRRGVIRGTILFRYDQNPRGWHSSGKIDESANVATSLAPLLGGVAVSERLQPQAAKLGLPVLFDARDKTEQWCLDIYGKQFTTRLMMTADPKSRCARSMAVAMRAFVVSRPGPVYQAALARCDPDSPVLGWGCGGEDEQTVPSSQWGLFQTATNWCHNLPVFDTEEIAQTLPAETVRSPRAGLSAFDLKWESSVHYVTFLMTDGDNVQWMMGNFMGGSEGRWYYESPARGDFPMGWTFPYVDLAQVCPYALQNLFQRASAGDDFVLYGGGYLYPDLFGSKRPGDAMSLHLRRIGEYMRVGGLRTLAYNLQRWDGPEAKSAYAKMAASIPTLDGIFTVQYYPYSGGEGRILWATRAGSDVPIISCAYCIWAQTGRPRDATPASVAAQVNRLPRGGPQWSEQSFSYIMAHAWSRFRDTHGDPSLTAEEQGVDQNADAPGTARGLLPVKWCVDRLEPGVRAVTPGQLALLVRLHLRTRQVLQEMRSELAPLANRSPSRRAHELLAEADRLLPGVRDGDDSGRECFEALVRARRLLSR